MKTNIAANDWCHNSHQQCQHACGRPSHYRKPTAITGALSRSGLMSPNQLALPLVRDGATTFPI